MNEELPKSPAARRRKLKRREHLCDWRFLTFSCYKCLPLMANPRIRDLFADRLRAAREQHRFRLIAWVVMPEHIHMIIVPRVIVGYDKGWPLVASVSTVRTIYSSLKKSVSERVLSRWRKLNAPILRRVTLPNGARHFWQPGGGFDRNARTEAEWWKEIRYIHQNPVRAGLVPRAEDWRWSSASWYAGEHDGQLPIDNDHGTTPWTPPEIWVRESIRIHPRGLEPTPAPPPVAALDD